MDKEILFPALTAHGETVIPEVTPSIAIATSLEYIAPQTLTAALRYLVATVRAGGS